MPRTKLKPNPEDYKQIREFLGSVSWGSDCYLVYPLDGSLCCLLVPNKVENYIVVPSHWRQWEERKPVILEIAQLFQFKPGAVLYGECPDYDCDRLSYDLAKSEVVTYWNGAANKIRYAGFLRRGLDGIDMFNPAQWNRQ